MVSDLITKSYGIIIYVSEIEAPQQKSFHVNPKLSLEASANVHGALVAKFFYQAHKDQRVEYLVCSIVFESSDRIMATFYIREDTFVGRK